MNPHGPSVMRLIFTKMAKDAIPYGGGLTDGVRFLSSKESIVNGYKAAAEWVEQALKLVREAADPNPWRNSTDEDIATHLLERINRKRHDSLSKP